ncbi:MAG: efflux RND transporter periplasmic adaptor subunit, partial [Alphaproteobacteria bacterium]|nr:efflux RND transporter periplasmic adaptor subunit [Alphaproteobacteria bacterium]
MQDKSGGKFELQIVNPDGSVFPYTGKITFADPSYNAQTGTFLIRATVDNPNGMLRPNQYVRARLKGGVRPNAILVPQRAVQQGAKGHFAWVINKAGLAEQRPVEVGDWYGDGWFVSQGLVIGDQLVVDGGQRPPGRGGQRDRRGGIGHEPRVAGRTLDPRRRGDAVVDQEDREHVRQADAE